MTVEIKRVLLEKAKIYKKYVKNGRTDGDHNLLRNITFKCRDLIRQAKEGYFFSLGKQLCDPNLDPKRYQSILHKFLNKRKIPQIPPLNNNDSFVTNFADKAELFNTFFAKQCTLIDTPSTLPQFSYATHHRLNTIDFVPEKLTSIIKTLNPNKAHGWDGISVRMIKICDDALIPPLKIIFNNIITTGIFPTSWKKANVVPVHKKEDKTLVKNYRPISLLAILEIFLKSVSMTLYMDVMKVIICLLLINLAFVRGIPVFRS